MDISIGAYIHTNKYTLQFFILYPFIFYNIIIQWIKYFILMIYNKNMGRLSFLGKEDKRGEAYRHN